MWEEPRNEGGVRPPLPPSGPFSFPRSLIDEPGQLISIKCVSVGQRGSRAVRTRWRALSSIPMSNEPNVPSPRGALGQWKSEKEKKKEVGARREEVGEMFSESVTQREREREKERERDPWYTSTNRRLMGHTKREEGKKWSHFSGTWKRAGYFRTRVAYWWVGCLNYFHSARWWHYMASIRMLQDV